MQCFTETRFNTECSFWCTHHMSWPPSPSAPNCTLWCTFGEVLVHHVLKMPNSEKFAQQQYVLPHTSRCARDIFSFLCRNTMASCQEIQRKVHENTMKMQCICRRPYAVKIYIHRGQVLELVLICLGCS